MSTGEINIAVIVFSFLLPDQPQTVIVNSKIQHLTYACFKQSLAIHLTQVARKVDNAIQVTHYPANSMLCFVNTSHWIAISNLPGHGM